jgi:lipopolysaccharide heptosyltransferase II
LRRKRLYRLLNSSEIITPTLKGNVTIQPQALAPARWDWQAVNRVLIVRLRSIGDTVLATPSIYALRRFLPSARIDILLEDWIAPLLEASNDIDEIISLKRGDTASRLKVIKKIRAINYDVVFNLHGGTTSTFITRMSRAKHRVGYAGYRYGYMHNHRAPDPNILWNREDLHSVEQLLGLLGWTGVPVTDLPPTKLGISEDAKHNIRRKLSEISFDWTRPFALIHPAAAFESKQWEIKNFARITEYLASCGLFSVAVVAPHERSIAKRLCEESKVPVVTFTDLSLPEITALAYDSYLFVGNDSGIAHISNAVGKPSVVIFGSSSIIRWRPWRSWNNVQSEIVHEGLPCAPCAGKVCKEFQTPQCIERITVERVIDAIERLLIGIAQKSV